MASQLHRARVLARNDYDEWHTSRKSRFKFQWHWVMLLELFKGKPTFRNRSQRKSSQRSGCRPHARAGYVPPKSDFWEEA